MTDGVWWQLLLSFGYGVLGSLVPMVSGEAFIIAALATKLIGPVALGVFLGLGQGIGKMILFQMIRQGRRLPVFRSRKPSAPPRTGKWRERWARLVAWSIGLVEHPKWGPVGCFLSGSLSLPPNYPTTVLAATTRINFAVFSISMSLGFIVRSLVVSLALAGVIDSFL